MSNYVSFFINNIFFLYFGLQVQHRWCELVVKHVYTQAYGDVEHFLIHNQVNIHNFWTFVLHDT